MLAIQGRNETRYREVQFDARCAGVNFRINERLFCYDGSSAAFWTNPIVIQKNKERLIIVSIAARMKGAPGK